MPEGELRVRVVDLLQAPVENATVRFYDGIAWSPAVLTDGAGMAVLRDVPAGVDRSIEVDHASRGWNHDHASVVPGGSVLSMLPNADTLLPAFSALARQLHGETSQYLVTLRLDADAGTFTSGRVVHGSLRYDSLDMREWGYDKAFDLPFAVRIP